MARAAATQGGTGGGYWAGDVEDKRLRAGVFGVVVMWYVCLLLNLSQVVCVWKTRCGGRVYDDRSGTSWLVHLRISS